MNYDKNCIIMHFPTYAGGKFIQNCLSLSKNCALMSLNTVDQIISNPSDYDYRLECVLSTLPKSENMKQWVAEYEFGDYEFYEDAFTDWQNKKQSTPTNKSLEVITSGLHFFITAHSLSVVSNIVSVWKDATIVSLINFEEFQKKAHKLKATTRCIDNANESLLKYSELKGNNWPSWNEFQNNAYDIERIDNVPVAVKEEIKSFYPTFNNKHVTFDVDKCFLHKDNFISEMKKLYNELNFYDFDEKNITKYWNRYIELHI